MKLGYIILIFLALMAPIRVFGQESMRTERVEASIQDNGNWDLTDLLTGITWHGQWISDRLMKVTGSDDSCFVIGENEHGMVQLNCQNLKEISILLVY